MSLVTGITALAQAVRDKINLMVPRLLPPGGSAGQVLKKQSATDYDAQWQNESAGGSDPYTYLKITADQASTAIAQANITGLSFAPQANKVYLVEAWIITKTTLATNGCRVGFSLSSGLSDAMVKIEQAASVTTTTVSYGSAATGLGNNTVTGHANTTGAHFAKVEAVLRVGANPSGSFSLTFASEAAGQSVSIGAGSFMRYREV